MAEPTRNQQLEQLLHAINHDLRASLSNIRSASAILLQDLSDPLTEDQRTFIKIIERSTVRLLDQSYRLVLLNQIAFAPFQPEPMQLTELLAHTTRILKNSYDIDTIILANEGDPLLACDEYTLSATLALLAAGDSNRQQEQRPKEPPAIHTHIEQNKLCFTIHSLMPAHELSHSLIELTDEVIQQHGGKLEVTEMNELKLFTFALPLWQDE